MTTDGNLEAEAARDLKTEERRKQILDAAVAVITRKGYHGTRMDDIVLESKLSKGALYWYFKSKKEILLALADRFIEADRSRIMGRVNLQTGFVQRLKAIVDAVVEVEEMALLTNSVLDDRKLAAEFWQQAVIDPDMHAKFAESYRVWQEIALSIVQEAMTSGEIRPMDAEAVSAILIAISDGLSWHWLLNVNKISNRRLLNALLEILFGGLLARGGPDARPEH